MTDEPEDDLFGFPSQPRQPRISTGQVVLSVALLMQDEVWRTARDIATELTQTLGVHVSPSRVTAILLDAKLWRQRGAVVIRKVYTTVGDQMFDNVYRVHHTQPE